MKAEPVRAGITHIRVEIPVEDARAFIAYYDVPHDPCCTRKTVSGASGAWKDLVAALRLVLCTK